MLFGLTYYLPEAVLTVGDNLEFLIRILVVELFGFLIGLERSKRQTLSLACASSNRCCACNNFFSASVM